MVDGEPEYEISKILDSKLDNRRHLCKLLYLVKWSGYEGTDNETSWLLATKLDNAPKLINHFSALLIFRFVSDIFRYFSVHAF